MSIAGIFRKQGGFSLLKQYVYNHVFLYAIIAFLIFPKNRKGLELFRECMNLKLYEKIKRKYKKIIAHQEFIKGFDDSNSKVIWFCWLQGVEKAPPLVQACYKSIKANCSDYEIHIITEKNFSDFVDIPDFIIKKWKSGIITHAHFSDILRTALLVENGGTWIDSTVLLTSSIPIDIENSPLFMFRTYKPGSDGKSTTLSSWFLSAQKNNPVLVLTQKLLYEYWKKHNYLCDYFLFHIFVQIALETLPEEAKKIPKYTNETPHFMLFELGNPFIQEKWDSITALSFCHKLTNKMEKDVQLLQGTFYKAILGEL